MRQARPIPGLFRVEGWVAAVDGRKLTIKMELRDGATGKLVSEAEALHIGPRESKVAMTDVFPGVPKALASKARL